MDTLGEQRARTIDRIYKRELPLSESQHQRGVRKAQRKHGKAPSIWATKPHKIVHLFKINRAAAAFLDGQSLLNCEGPIRFYALFAESLSEQSMVDLILQLETLLDRNVVISNIETTEVTQGLLRLNIPEM